jgi:hypothetical protein
VNLVSRVLLTFGLFALTGEGLTIAKGEPTVKETLALAETEKTEKASRPVSEVQFHITDTSLGKARLIPAKVQETVIPPPGYCGAVDGGKEITGRFRLEFEIEGKALAAYLLDLTFVEGHLWDPRLKKSSLPLPGQSKEQIVVIQYQGCNSISALIFGYDLKQDKMVRYSFTNHFGERSLDITLSTGTTVSPDGSVKVFEQGKPKDVFQESSYTQVWGTVLRRYLFDQPTHSFLEIPIVVAMKIWPGSTGSNGVEFVLYEDGYLTDMRGEEKFISKDEVSKLLESEAAEGVLRLREKSGSWDGPTLGSGWPLYGFFFGINFNIFQVGCGEDGCPKELLSMKDKLLQFWRKGR